MTNYRSVVQTILLLAFVACAGTCDAAAATPTAYHVSDLGSLGGGFTAGFGINATGQVAGYSFTPGYASVHAILYDGTLHDLGQGTGFGINDSGQVTGRSGSGHAFLYDGTMNDLGTLGGGTVSEGRGINASGHVAGYSFTTGFPSVHAFLYDGILHDLAEGTAYGINGSGQVTGSSYTIGGALRAFLWTPTTPNGASGTMHDLGTLGGGQSGGAAVNGSGKVTGYSATTGDTANHAFLYDSALHDLGTLGGTNSHGNGINESGQVVGDSHTTGDASDHAFLYTSGSGMVDLNTLIDPLSGWQLTVANAINDVGQITGYGFNGSETRAFLLTPVPEPASLALLALGLPLLVLRSSGRAGTGRLLS